MRRIPGSLTIIIFILLTGCSVFQRRAASDTVVLPLGNEVKVTDGSAVYALPLTVFEFDIVTEKTTEVPGPYARFAADMLGLDNVVTRKTETWTLKSVGFRAVEELDPGQFYVIQGTTLMQSNLLALREAGLILDINPDIYSNRLFSGTFAESRDKGMLFPDRGASGYAASVIDTAYKVVRADTAFIRVPYLIEKKKGITLEEEAREASDRLLELREGKHMILTGETNLFPQDRAAIDEINRLDYEYTALFAGKRWSTPKHFKIWITPDLSMAGSRTTLFRFSGTEGVLPAGADKGLPVEMLLSPSGKTKEINLVLRPAALQKEPAIHDKLFYRVPDVVDIKLISGNETLCEARKLVYQFGTVVTLPSNLIIGMHP